MIFIRLLTVFLLVSTAYAGGDNSLIEKIDKTTSFKANFIHKLFSESDKLIQEEKGVISFMKPGKFKWEVLSPGDNLVISDGKTIWNYDADLEQVIVNKVNKENSATPAFFLTGYTDKIKTDYNVEQKNCGADTECFDLKPKNNDVEFQTIKMTFKGNNIQNIKLTDQLGQKSILQFSNIDSNPDLKKEMFTFVIPEGVDIINSTK